MFDKGSITLNKGTLDPLQNHSYENIGNVHNKQGNLPLTEEDFMEQFNRKQVNLNNINNVQLQSCNIREDGETKTR